MEEYCAVCGAKLDKDNKYMDNMCWDCKFGGAEEYEEMHQKDWTGNSKSTFVTLGASNHVEHERAENDYYATDPHALEIFLEKLKQDGGGITLSHNIWECACGNGNLSKVLMKQGYNVISTDLIDRGYGIANYDFLTMQELPDQVGQWDILTNPPYKYAKEFVEKALELTKDGRYVIMFLKIQFLEGKARRKLFDEFPPKFIYVNSERQICYLNGDDSKKMSSATCYCWYVWEKGWKGEPVVRWI